MNATYIVDRVNVDEHPCQFVYICAKPFEEKGNLRNALHISQDCPKSLVDAMEFETILPPETTYGDYLEHYDSNGDCTLNEDGQRLTCTSVITKPKLAPGDEPGNDDAWLLPSEYNDGGYPWSYKYFIYRTDPEAPTGQQTQPFSEIPGAEFGPGESFSTDGSGGGVPGSGGSGNQV